MGPCPARLEPRGPLALALLLAALLGAGATGCASRPKAQVPVVATAPQTRLRIDFSPLFGVHQSMSLVDDQMRRAGLMDRVLVEPEVLDGTGESPRVEHWLRRALLGHLSLVGSVVYTAHPGPAAGAGEVAEGAPRPTAALRHLAFTLQQHPFPVVVVRDDPVGFTVQHGGGPGVETVCPGLKLELDFIQLVGTLQRLSDGAVAGSLHELVIVPLGGPAVIELVGDEGALCDVVVAAFKNEALRPSDLNLQDAADTALTAAFPLRPPPPESPVAEP